MVAASEVCGRSQRSIAGARTLKYVTVATVPKV